MAVAKAEILETIGNMSVLEIVDLISAMEEKFGVTAAVAVAAAPLAGGAAAAVTALALVLQLAAAVLVGVTGQRGGELTYEHGANVKLGGVLVKNPAAAGGEHAARPDSAADGEKEDDD